MKTLFQIKETSASSVRHCCRVLSLIVALTAMSNGAWAAYYLYYNSLSNTSCWSTQDNPNPFRWTDGVDPVSNVCTWTIDLQQYNNYVYVATGNATGNILNIDKPGTNDYSGASYVNAMDRNDCDQKNYVRISTTQACTVKIQFDQTNHKITVSDADTPGPTPGGDALPVTSSSYAGNSPELFFYITGFGGSTAKYKNTDTYTLTVESGTAVVKERSDAAGTARLYYTLSSGYPLSGTNVFRLVHEESGDCAIVTFYNLSWQSTEKCSSEPTGDAPKVYWAQYPEMGVNQVSMFGYLVKRDCNTITDAGFYWSTSHINTEAAKTAIAAGGTNYIIHATSPATIRNLVAGQVFSAESATLVPALSESKTIYMVNYAKTDEGGIGISDEVALSYDFCKGMSADDVTLNQTSLSLPQDYKFTFEVTARNAGKHPIYVWKDGSTVIDGATGNTLEYTMPDASEHNISVTVTGHCGEAFTKTATVSSCYAPTITFTSETSATPWIDVPVQFTVANVSSAEWSVAPDADLSTLTKDGNTYSGKFRGGVNSGDSTNYDITVTAKSSCSNSGIEITGVHKIEVTKDTEQCDNPAALY